MFRIPRIPPKLRPYFRPLCLLALTFALSAAQLGGTYAPCALAVAALAGPKLPGFGSLLGAAAGALAFFDFQPGLRFLASAILIFSVNTAFYDSPIYARPAFRSASAAAVTALVQSIYLLERPLRLWVVFALSVAVQCLAVHLLSPLWEKRPSAQDRSRAAALLLLSACSALIPLESGGFSLGRALLSGSALLIACTCVSPASAAALGLAAGAAADLAGSTAAPVYAAALALGCTAGWAARQRRWLAGPLFALSAAAAAVLFDADRPLALLYEAAMGASLYLLLPRQVMPKAAPQEEAEALPPSPLQNQMAQSAAAFRALYDSFFRGTSPTPPENPSVIFDQAAEQVCRSCVLCTTCWHRNYNETYNAFNDACGALLRRGQACPQDFPVHFSSRCVHFSDFLAAVNAELRAFLQRQQYHRRLVDLRRQAQEQYAQLGELLSGTAAVETMTSAPLGYRIGSVLQPRQGCRVCGDQLAVFEAGSTLYLLLSDGMGSGEDAHREAAMTVRLLQQFLQSGIEPAPALKTLNAALRLRGEDGGGFTTIDLLALQRGSGGAVLYKYGAAPSYLKRSGTVTRFTASSLPAGLQEDRQGPECCRFSLPGGSFFVMVSDGIADETDDEWLQNLLSGWNGTDATALANLILSERRSRRGLQDDCAILTLHLSPPDEGQKTPV
ncbi:MAG: stage II sporulation protein E [Ruminococcaceae bacterium]|nr:stage II sporulation protein E [Oscillospiraceae bacterium]